MRWEEVRKVRVFTSRGEDCGLVWCETSRRIGGYGEFCRLAKGEELKWIDYSTSLQRGISTSKESRD